MSANQKTYTKKSCVWFPNVVENDFKFLPEVSYCLLEVEARFRFSRAVRFVFVARVVKPDDFSVFVFLNVLLILSYLSLFHLLTM